MSEAILNRANAEIRTGNKKTMHHKSCRKVLEQGQHLHEFFSSVLDTIEVVTMETGVKSSETERRLARKMEK